MRSSDLKKWHLQGVFATKFAQSRVGCPGSKKRYNHTSAGPGIAVVITGHTGIKKRAVSVHMDDDCIAPKNYGPFCSV